MGRWRLEPNGRLEPAPAPGAEATLTLDEPTFTQILWGAMRPSQAIAWGRAHLSGGAPELPVLDAALAQPSLFIPRFDDF